MRFKDFFNEAQYKQKPKKNIIKKDENQSGRVYALVQLEGVEDGYIVMSISKNYDGKIRGGERKSWVIDTPKKMNMKELSEYEREGLSQNDALKLYNKKLKSKTK